ncbi:hypothetical protein Lal_00022739 [Lupinus albus]|nr:hypothetical protein Lal_00022739 [Lupinus albus]
MLSLQDLQDFLLIDRELDPRLNKMIGLGFHLNSTCTCLGASHTASMQNSLTTQLPLSYQIQTNSYGILSIQFSKILSCPPIHTPPMMEAKSNLALSHKVTFRLNRKPSLTWPALMIPTTTGMAKKTRTRG